MAVEKYRSRRTRSATRAPRTARANAEIPIAKLRKLAAALEHDESPGTIPEQIQGLCAQLADLGERTAAAAAAVLAHTRRGSPIARAYLDVLARDASVASDASGPRQPVAAADEIARYCATMTRGRKALRPVFLATWQRAADPAALEAAWKNLARIAIDDPGLLAVAIEAASRLGNASALADRTARLERAHRLAPLVAGLAGPAALRARSLRQLDALDAEDRRHIYARVVDDPRRYDKALAIAAVIALVDDPRAPDMALAAAVFEMGRPGKDALVAAWRPRVIAGDTALIVRLLALFEWTGLWATDDDPFDPYIRALAPAGRHPDVFSQVESGLASDKAAVREAILVRWLGDPAAFAAFSDAQADNLMRSAIAIAEAGTATADQRAAHRVASLAGNGRTGVHRALIDGVRHANTRKAAELRRQLYAGLQRIEHPEVVAFLVEQLFTERAAYTALMDALAAWLDADTHRVALDALARRRTDPAAIHAATVYAEILLDRRRSPRLLGDLARAVLTWQPNTTDDRRRLRYLFEQATLAQIAILLTRDARAFLARARALEVTPYSDYQVVDRDRRTPAAFAEPSGKKLVVALETGAIDRDIAIARAAAQAARAAATPVPADDDRLGALAGCTVASRWLDDRDHHEVWFFDELGDLHVYDGYDVVLPPFEVSGRAGRGLSPAGVAAFLAGHAEIDDRLVLLDPASPDRIREVLRLGERLLVHDGAGTLRTGALTILAIGLRFADPGAARDAVGRFAAHPPAGNRVDPFHVAGVGTLHRSYQLAGAGAAECQLAIADHEILGVPSIGFPPLAPTHATPEAAIAALQAWEARVLCAGGRITKISLDRGAAR